MYEEIRELYKAVMLEQGESFDLEYNDIYSKVGHNPEAIKAHFRAVIEPPFGTSVLNLIESKQLIVSKDWKTNRRESLLIDIAIELEFEIIYP